MPLHALAVQPADVSGAGLRLALNVAAPEPLAVHPLTHPGGGTLVLGVLGASHLITVEHANVGFSEQVSCTASTQGAALPERAEAAGYHLESDTARHLEADFRDLATRLREHCADDPAWLGGSFPGDENALTALHAEPDGAGWRWETWHLYPDAPGGTHSTGGTVVHTASRWRP